MDLKAIKSLFRIYLRIIILVLTLLSINQNSFSQNINNNDSTFYYKNALKGFIVFFFPLSVLYTGFSIGYERCISRHSALELAGYYLYHSDEMGLDYNTICLMPAYKYFTVSKRKGLNNIWVSGYLSYLYETHKHPESESDIKENLYYYGIGASVGKKINLTKDKKIFFDIGFGYSYYIYDDKPMFSDNDWANRFLPKPIIQIGGKF